MISTTVVFFHYKISEMASFVLLRYEISLTVGFVPFQRCFKDGRFCFFTKFQSVLIFHEISVVDGFLL